jgi:cell wall-associated NlpC family hydrolase
MNGAEAVDYIIALNETSETPVVGFETTRYTTAEEEIAYDTIELEDDEFAQGETQVTQEGVNGKREITSLETLVNGEVVATEVVEETVIEEPVDKVVVTGTKEPEPEPEPEAVSSGSSSGSSSGGSGGHAAAGGGLSTAYDMIGVPYVWGGTSTSGVDCSGLVNVCYGGARGRTTYAMIGSLQSTGDWKTSMSELNVGDLVFPHSGHVGIYIGDGMMIHAPSPGRSVCIAPVYSFYGGGPY